MTKERYVRTEGETVLDGKTPEEKLEAGIVIAHAVTIQLIRQLGGHVVVTGLGDPAEVEKLLEYELALRGLGDGQVEVSLRKRA